MGLLCLSSAPKACVFVQPKSARVKSLYILNPSNFEKPALVLFAEFWKYYSKINSFFAGLKLKCNIEV
ncbi:MAG: hypothetical protein AVO38_10800 [delta proteobacterium ML8_D]|nr:MAG: hypothetical protein AVO38_10800 [delta proteobacterium ML8_D]